MIHVHTKVWRSWVRAWTLLGLALTLFAIASSTAAAPFTPFNYVQVDIFAGGATDGTSVMSSATMPVFVERGIAPGAYSEARAGFGSTGFAALSGAAGASMWSDGFLVLGGTGSGLIRVSVQIDGTVVGPQPDMSYTLFSSNNPFDLQVILDSLTIDDQNPQVPGANSVLHTENFHGGVHVTGALDRTLVGSIPFTYGQPLYLASVFGGDVCGDPFCAGNSENFFNSADFGITVPAGASLITQSQTVYAAAVPEPTTLALLAAAAIGVLLTRRRAARALHAAAAI